METSRKDIQISRISLASSTLNLNYNKYTQSHLQQVHSISFATITLNLISIKYTQFSFATSTLNPHLPSSALNLIYNKCTQSHLQEVASISFTISTLSFIYNNLSTLNLIYNKYTQSHLQQFKYTQSHLQ